MKKYPGFFAAMIGIFCSLPLIGTAMFIRYHMELYIDTHSNGHLFPDALPVVIILWLLMFAICYLGVGVLFSARKKALARLQAKA